MTIKSTRRSGKPAEITEAGLRQLLQGGAPIELRALQEADGYYLEANVGGAVMRLAKARGAFRLFSTLDTVANVVAKLGAKEFMTTVAPAPRSR